MCCWRTAFFVLATILALSGSVKAQNFSDLYYFSGGTSDGSGPTGSLIDVNGIFYGMTPGGGADSKGTIFSFNPDTDTETLLYSFVSFPNDGAIPLGSFTQSTTNSSILYGMTSIGGSADAGAIIEYNTATNTESMPASFDVPQLNNPNGSLIQSGSNLFGIAANLFSFNLNTNVASVLYAFQGRPDGAVSGGVGTPVQVGNVMYGMNGGGGASGHGAIFSYNLTTNTETVVHSFSGDPDGNQPMGSLTQSGSVLFGMTSGGGTGSGTIFSYDTSDEAYKILFSFGPGDGADPEGDLLVDGSTLFGMATNVVFAFNTLTDTETVLHRFSGSDGGEGEGDLLLIDNTLYGMTSEGGTNDDGVIFSVTIPEPASATLIMAVGGAMLCRRPRRKV
jgi:uncharacterized repeat protein (TIGR03803 family)